MTTVVTANCQKCRYTDCVTVCPVACFHADDEMLYIDNAVCIDCGACVPVCPVRAIYEEADLPDDLRIWIEINAERAPGLPSITEKEDPYPGADARKAELGF
jgi:ferredoxin